MSILTQESIDGFKEAFQGGIVLPGDPNYDETRALWNAMIDKRPGVIAQCSKVEDVVAAVNYGRSAGLDIAIRGGGHNIAGKASCDKGLMIDLSLMREVRVDVANRRAYVGPGATLGDVDRETQKHGLVVPTGINSTTGIAGLTLGGGFGWTARKFGMTIDSLVSVELVTAQGETVRASSEENSDLFWAVRGGGGNFGVVTKFEFRLHSMGPEVLTGLIVFDLSEGKSVLRRYREYAKSIPEEMTVWTVMRKAPPLPFLPEAHHGKEVVVMALCYTGDPEDGQKYVDPIRSFGAVIGEFVGVQPFTDWQQAFDPLLVEGFRNYWKSHDFLDIEDGLIDEVISYVERLPSDHSEIFFGQMGGIAGRVAPGATAFGNRDANYRMNVHTRWERPEEDERCIAWARDYFEATKPFSTGGVYVNFMSEDETDRISAAYGTNYARLASIKKQYDPDNLFHINQNIKPS